GFALCLGDNMPDFRLRVGVCPLEGGKFRQPTDFIVLIILFLKRQYDFKYYNKRSVFIRNLQISLRNISFDSLSIIIVNMV
ncbi:hypothetical protein, partial [Muribacter muris]|uniref:hypothetical protein n=1 Tax=Muribacter muris TaxID=67855 RepID=UPI001D16F65E